MDKTPVSLSAYLKKLRSDLEKSEAPVRSQMILAWEEAIAAFEYDLWAVTQLIEDARLAGHPISPSWLYKQERYQEMIRHATHEIERFQNQTANPLLDTMVHRGTREGTDVGGNLLERSQIISAFGSRPNVRAVDTLYQMMTGQESPVRDVIAKYGPYAEGVIRDYMGQGIIQGLSPREVVRNIMRDLTGGANRARISTLVRTEHMRAVRLASAEMYKQYAHAINGFRWVAAHQIRTCLACLAMDGKTYPNPEMQIMHPNCRCVLVPIGKYTPPEYQYETGEEWLRRQSEATQRAMFPSHASWEAYRDGKLPLANFVKTEYHPIWGVSITENSGIGAMKSAGIEIKPPPIKTPPKPKTPASGAPWATPPEPQSTTQGPPVYANPNAPKLPPPEAPEYPFEFEDDPEWFTNERIDNWAAQWGSHIPQEQADAIINYRGNGYEGLNHYLRTGETGFNKDTRQHKTIAKDMERQAALIDKGMYGVAIPEDRQVFRGASSSAFGRQKPVVGGIYTDHGFMSTSFDIETANEFARNSSSDEVYVLRMDAMQGTKSVYMEGLNHRGPYSVGVGENELLFPRGTIIEVLDISPHETIHNAKYVDAVIISQEGED